MVVRLHPIRVLVVGGDLAYRERAVAVLAELGPVGFSGVTPGDQDELLAVIRDERPDVLVLDASGCEAAVGQLIVALAARPPAVGIVVVCEQATSAARRLGALP